MAATNPTTAQDWLDRLVEAETEMGITSRSGLRQRQAQVLSSYSATFNITAATKAAGVARQRVSRWRLEDPIFAEAWGEAERCVADVVRGELFERAVHGHEVVVRDRHGHQVGTERRPSDRLLLALAKALDPVRFGGNVAATPVDDNWRTTLLRVADEPEALAALDVLADVMVGTPPVPASNKVALQEIAPRADEITPGSPPARTDDRAQSARWPAEPQHITDRLQGRQSRRDYQDPDSP